MFQLMQLVQNSKPLQLYFLCLIENDMRSNAVAHLDATKAVMFRFPKYKNITRDTDITVNGFHVQLVIF